MGNVAFNISKHKIGYYFGLPATNDAIKVLVLEYAGLVADPAMQDYDTVAALLAGASNEQTTMGRKTMTGVTTTIDDSNELVKFAVDNFTWTAAGGTQTGALVFYYDPDTTASSDSNNIPLLKYDFIVSPSGGDVVVQAPNFAVVGG